MFLYFIILGNIICGFSGPFLCQFKCSSGKKRIILFKLVFVMVSLTVLIIPSTITGCHFLDKRYVFYVGRCGIRENIGYSII